MLSCNLNDLYAWIDGRDVRGGRQTCGAFGKDAAAAADVEIAKISLRRCVRFQGVTGGNEVMAQGVHKVEEA